MSLSKLIVAGFRSIREQVEIPIAPLTLLFGPNSAGKTAMVQALEALSARLGDEADSEPTWARTLTAAVRPARYAHQAPEPDDDGDRALAPTVLGAEFDSFDVADTVYEQHRTAAQSVAADTFEGLYGARLKLTLAEVSGGAQGRSELCVSDRPMLHLAEFGVVDAVQQSLGLADSLGDDSADGGGQPVSSTWGACFVHLDHPLFAQGSLLPTLKRLVDAAAAARSSFLRFSLRVSEGADRVLMLRAPCSRFRIAGWAGASNYAEFEADVHRQQAAGTLPQLPETYHEVAAVRADIDFLCTALTHLLKHVCAGTRRQLQTARVAGGRSMLDEAQLSAAFASKWPSEPATPLEAYARWLGMHEAGLDPVVPASTETPARFDDLVNDALRKDLFIERPYRVRADTSRITEETLAGRDEIGSFNERLSVSLYLEDANGRTLDFDEVGSGISYVMPVLAALWNADRSWIEQPELHLHPAAQCGLGDVLIRAVNRGRFAIAETHSEHLLLRVLRRIRQTVQGAEIDPELRCSPELVAVLYFEPQPDGGTLVHRLRVSRGGDFMDRWPRGFFEEREQELFDE